MFHQIEFCGVVIADVEQSRQALIYPMVFKFGERLTARLKPYVAESTDGLVEVADLYLQDGTIVKEAPYAAFRFFYELKVRQG